METQTNETREQLKARLKQKISSKKGQRTNGITRKKGEHLNDAIKNISNILSESKIENPEQIDSSLLETIMNTISKKDLELILNKMQENTKFKDILNSIKDKFSES